MNIDVSGETNSSDKFSLQNPHMLRVRMTDGDILTQKGAMVAYQGDFRFEHHSSGMSRLAKKALSSDNVSLMHARGSGDLFLAVRGLRVQVARLEDEEIFVEPGRLLAIDEGINWDLRMTARGSRMYAGGLWHMQLAGTGWVAFLSDGQPLLLDCREGTAVDKQALVAWSGGLETSLRRDTSWKTWTGRTSGESVQIFLEGEGWVVVQPSERDEGESSGGGFSLLNTLIPF